MPKRAMIAALLLTACSSGSVASDTKAIHQPKAAKTVRVSGFNRLAVSGVDDVRVQLGKPFAVRVEGPADILDQMIIAREADLPGRVDAAKAEFANNAVFAALETTLRIDRKWKSAREWTTQNPVRVTVYIEMPQLEAIDMNSSGTMRVSGVQGKQFMAGLGNGKLFLPDISVDRLSLAIVNGNIVANGVARNLDISNGSQIVDLRQLVVEDATIKAEGSGSVFADVRGQASVSISGSGNADLGKRSHCVILKKNGSGKLRCGTVAN